MLLFAVYIVEMDEREKLIDGLGAVLRTPGRGTLIEETIHFVSLMVRKVLVRFSAA